MTKGVFCKLLPRYEIDQGWRNMMIADATISLPSKLMTSVRFRSGAVPAELPTPQPLSYSQTGRPHRTHLTGVLPQQGRPPSRKSCAEGP